MRIGIIGLGRLGLPLARGLVRTDIGDLVVFNRSSAKTEALKAEYPQVTVADRPDQVFADCQIVFLWMAGDDARNVIDACQTVIAEKSPIVVGCDPSTPLAGIVDRWVMSLPNVCSSTGQGSTLLSFSAELSAADRELVETTLAAIGDVHEVSYEELYRYGVVTSNGPAIYARFMETWADVVADYHGLDKGLCRSMALQATLGTVRVQEDNRLCANDVIYQVAHPGGSTRQALALLDGEFPHLAQRMVDAIARH